MKKFFIPVVSMVLFLFLPANFVKAVESHGGVGIEIVSESEVPISPPSKKEPSGPKNYLPATGEKENKIWIALGCSIIVFIFIKKNRRLGE